MSLKVLMFGWELAPILHGGLGVVCRSIVDNLLEKDIEVNYVIPKLPKKITIPGANLIDLSEFAITHEQFHYHAVESLITPYTTSLSYRKSLARYLETMRDDADTVYGKNLFIEIDRYANRVKDFVHQLDFDVIHAHDWMTFKAAVVAKNLTKKPLILHVHASEYERSAGNPDPRVLEQEKFGFAFADKIIAVSNVTKDKIVNLYGIDPDKVEVVHNAVEITDTSKKPVSARSLINHDERMVLFLARLAVQKGADYLLRAAKKVLDHMDNVKFVFVGKGEMIDDLINLSIELGISDNVVFTGFLDHDQVDKAYQQADLFVMPSISEPFGVTALEAIRNGTPVLISKQSGAGEVIKNCLKVDFWDVNLMAEKILSVLKYAPLKETLSEHGYYDLDNLNWSQQTEKIINVYRQLID